MTQNPSHQDLAGQETVYCPYCGEVISAAAKICRHCGGYPRDGYYGHPRYQVRTTHIKIGFFEGLYFGLGLLVSGVLFTIIISVIFLCGGGALILLLLGGLSQ
jgi:hypothetical protein